MKKNVEVEISFGFEPFKVLFEEMFLKKISLSNTTIFTCNSEKEDNYKDLIYSSQWISIQFHKSYFLEYQSSTIICGNPYVCSYLVAIHLSSGVLRL